MYQDASDYMRLDMVAPRTDELAMWLSGVNKSVWCLITHPPFRAT